MIASIVLWFKVRHMSSEVFLSLIERIGPINVIVPLLHDLVLYLGKDIAIFLHLQIA